MCSRFEQKVHAGEIARRFGLSDIPPAVNASEIRPTDQALVVTTNGQFQMMGWGFQVPWDKKPLINARSETLEEKPTFKDKLLNRCLIPASAYFEWRKENGNKLKNRIQIDGSDEFMMAGLVDNARFSIITCAPSPSIAHIHSRMPVILSVDGEVSWLDSNLNFSDVNKYLLPLDQAPFRIEEEKPAPPAQGDLFG